MSNKKNKYPSGLNRSISYFFGLLSLTLPVIIYQLHIKWLGFPDGGLTEFERAENFLYRIFIWPGFALGLYFLYLGWTASKQKIKKKLVISICIFIFIIIATIIVDYYFSLHFDNGGGG
ncbi:MAG: hypothetical protein KKH98_07945 [Spirochaetes bacterium]|nr:hypothetical protein [Spirochaetota bacterium]